MKWTAQASACLAVMLLAACNGNRNNRNAGAPSGTESGSMSDTGRMSSDTGMRSTGGMSSDTTRSGMTRSDTSAMNRSDTTSGRSSRTHSDTAKSNQTKSGVTNTKTGKSTLGPGVTKTRPDQGQPVTSKGDTINKGVDSSGAMDSTRSR
jgi:hypothetical protein